jgi:hypothetical protein
MTVSMDEPINPKYFESSSDLNAGDTDMQNSKDSKKNLKLLAFATLAHALMSSGFSMDRETPLSQRSG